MHIEVFLSEQGRARAGRIPLQDVSQESLWRAGEELQEVIARAAPRLEIAVCLIRAIEWSLRVLAEGRFQYRDLSILTSSYEPARIAPGSHLNEALTAFIVAVHDHYVIGKNGASGNSRAMASERGGRPCRQCGACCIGSASGPISTNPLDISRWRELGRDDLLYYTSLDSGEGGDRARSLVYVACPFLRFTDTGRGHCLVHPVKPAICQAFDCSPPNSCGK